MLTPSSPTSARATIFSVAFSFLADLRTLTDCMVDVGRIVRDAIFSYNCLDSRGLSTFAELGVSSTPCSDPKKCSKISSASKPYNTELILSTCDR
jgi:hypothetical protein